MGNLCSSSSDKPSGDNFSSPGRVLGAPAQSSSSSAPVPRDRIAASNTTSPGRTLGGGSAGAGGTYGGTAQGQGQGDARSAAARAAEERAAKADQTPGTRPSGKLAGQLNAQKKQTRNELLGAASQQERRARDADEGREARAWE